MRIIKKYSGIIAGAILGGVAGYLYWNYVGCVSGQCAITSVWYKSTIYGSLTGGIFASTFSKKIN